jgi:hypothetical protein
MFKAFNFRSERSFFSFKYYRVNFLFCELASAVHEGGDLLDGGIVLKDAVDIEWDDRFEGVTVEPIFPSQPFRRMAKRQ